MFSTLIISNVHYITCVWKTAFKIVSDYVVVKVQFQCLIVMLGGQLVRTFYSVLAAHEIICLICINVYQ